MHSDRGAPHWHQKLLSPVVQGQWVVLNLKKLESDSEFHRMPRNDLEDAKELHKAFPTFSQAGSRLKGSLRVMHAHSDLSTLIAHVDWLVLVAHQNIGGPSSLEVEPGGKRVIDISAFKERPEWLQNEARGGVEFRDILCSVSDLDWTFLSPAALITDLSRRCREEAALFFLLN